MKALIALVGAGPGDPELLTVRAVRRLTAADLVLYDALVAPQALDLAPQARRSFVGKRAGRHAVRQEEIHRLMIRAARRGQRVVRLKGGDPFVLGRGGEEALALAAAGIPFEIVPGISSAVAAPALAGIPVTQRGRASAFVVVSGHSPEAYGPVLDSLRPGSATLVVLMGLAGRQLLAKRLIGRRWKRDTPAAIIWSAALPDAHHWLGTLDTLGANQGPEGRPGVIVIGPVVELASQVASSLVETITEIVPGHRPATPHGRVLETQTSPGTRSGSNRTVVPGQPAGAAT